MRGGPPTGALLIGVVDVLPATLGVEAVDELGCVGSIDRRLNQVGDHPFADLGEVAFSSSGRHEQGPAADEATQQSDHTRPTGGGDGGDGVDTNIGRIPVSLLANCQGSASCVLRPASCVLRPASCVLRPESPSGASVALCVLCASVVGCLARSPQAAASASCSCDALRDNICMYDFLRGTVANLDTDGRLSLDVNGVGYSLRISEQCRSNIPLDGSPVTLPVRLVVRDDDLILFGFIDVAERGAFDLLTSVQQVGPSVALAVLSAHSVSTLRTLLLTRDVGTLKKVKGVGPKTAERIVLELVDKVARIPEPFSPKGAKATPEEAAIGEAHRALVVLGFGPKEATDALARTAKPGISGEDLLRAALGVLR
jgi:holliday junction DNA helicase RuvA